jgi:hypothetical protein
MGHFQILYNPYITAIATEIHNNLQIIINEFVTQKSLEFQ